MSSHIPLTLFTVPTTAAAPLMPKRGRGGLGSFDIADGGFIVAGTIVIAQS